MFGRSKRSQSPKRSQSQFDRLMAKPKDVATPVYPIFTPGHPLDSDGVLIAFTHGDLLFKTYSGHFLDIGPATSAKVTSSPSWDDLADDCHLALEVGTGNFLVIDSIWADDWWGWFAARKVTVDDSHPSRMERGTRPLPPAELVRRWSDALEAMRPLSRREKTNLLRSASSAHSYELHGPAADGEFSMDPLSTRHRIYRRYQLQGSDFYSMQAWSEGDFTQPEYPITTSTGLAIWSVLEVGPMQSHGQAAIDRMLTVDAAVTGRA